MNINLLKKMVSRLRRVVEPACSVWGNGVPCKGGKTTNYDESLDDKAVREKVYGRKEGAVNA